MRSKEFLKLTIITITLTVGLLSFSWGQSKTKNEKLFAQENLIAWCIVPFDNQHRSPQQRVDMLKHLGFTQYAYDWRHEHIPSFRDEIKLAKENGIRIAAVWLWIDNGTDKVGQLSEDNEQILSIMKESGLKTRLWVGFNNNFFAGENDDSKIAKGVEMLQFLKKHASQVATGVGLYNHGDWFGEPDNQIKILKQLNDPNFGLIYNFHHGHSQVQSFPALLDKMIPWLWTVNINGMKKDGPQILPVGSGDQEFEMLRTLKKSAFHGSIGILGHIEDDDVEKVLQRNLGGLQTLQERLK